MELIDIFSTLPHDILTTIFILLTDEPRQWPYRIQGVPRKGSLAKALRYFRISKVTYNLREYLLHEYTIQIAINTAHSIVHIPSSKNIYPYLLLHYFGDKVPRKGRYNHERFILEFLANKNCQTTVVQYKDLYIYHSIVEFCCSHGLTCGEGKWNTHVKSQYNGYSMIIYKPKPIDL